MNIQKILIANRGEIAIRILHGAVALHIPTAAFYTYEDCYSLHRHRAEEAGQAGSVSNCGDGITIA